MPNSKPRKGEVRKRIVTVPDHPWPIGSLCANVVNLDGIDAKTPYYEIKRKSFQQAVVDPDVLIRVGVDGNTRPLISIPHLYLGLAMLEEPNKLPHVELVFLSSWGCVSWDTEFEYDGQLRSISAFMKRVNDVFRCISRIDKAIG